MFMSHHKTTGQNYFINTDNKSFDNESKFKQQGMNQNCIHKETKSRLHSWNASYHAVQNILSSHLLSKTVNVKIKL